VASLAAPRALVFSTEEERDFVRRRFANLTLRGDIVSVGIEAPSDRNPERFRKRFGIEEPFLLYLGRIEKSKGVDVLFEDFIRYREARRGPKKLVLVGREHTVVPRQPDIVVVGQVDEQA